MTRALLEEAKRADEQARLGPPGMLHLDLERLGGEAENLTFGAAA